VGRLLDETRDGLVLASRDENTVTLLDLQSPTTASAPVEVPFMLLGPAVVVTLPVTSQEAPGRPGLFIGSVYNSPDENVGSIYVNTSDGMEVSTEMVLPGLPVHGQQVQLSQGGATFLGVIYQTATGASLAIQRVSTGQLVNQLVVDGLDVNMNYAMAGWPGEPQRSLLLWVPGSKTLTVRPILAATRTEASLEDADTHTVDLPIRSLVPLPELGQGTVFMTHADGTSAGLYSLGGGEPLTPTHTLNAPKNHMFTGAVGIDEGLVTFQSFTNGGSSVRYQLYELANGQLKESSYGSLPTLADNDNLTIPDIRARIVERHPTELLQGMPGYTNTIPGTSITYRMVAIPGGEFLMGSPATEAGRQPAEGPQHRVNIAPFWMGECEVTWNEFELFMYPDQEKRLRQVNPTDADADGLADAVSHPSKPYADMTFGMGRAGYPAIAMTQHAANKYCQWLSAKTGHFYRLPTEAEWEYAARAGTSTAYFFGEEDDALGDYAWYEMNSDFKYQKVGRKKPNPWGLHDIYGNVVEWVLDQYDPDVYAARSHMNPLDNPWNKATRPYPLSVRGGSWDDGVAACRSAARRGSDRVWKLQDPQLPKSTWYFTDADFVGFRLVRPLEVPDAAAMQAYWNNGVERE
jgi:formylglycine-generating enzyme required for sulfatase activity